MKVTAIPKRIVALGKVSKGLEEWLGKLEIRKGIVAIQTTTLLKSGYLEEFWRPKETCCHSDFSEKPQVRPDVKN